MKPILFNTEMVRAILDGHKSVTRWVVKPQPPEGFIQSQEASGQWFFNDKSGDNDMMEWWPSYEKGIVPLYCPGDILYVRETWNGIRFGNGVTVPLRTEYWYKADDTSQNPDDKWRPSIRMPKEAARLFLRVTGVRVERLWRPFFANGPAIMALGHEGIALPDVCIGCIGNYGFPCCIDANEDDECGVLDEVRGDYSDLWDSTIKKADLPRYGWAANPWVWVIEFERISKEAALQKEKS